MKKLKLYMVIAFIIIGIICVTIPKDTIIYAYKELFETSQIIDFDSEVSSIASSVTGDSLSDNYSTSSIVAESLATKTTFSDVSDSVNERLLKAAFVDSVGNIDSTTITNDALGFEDVNNLPEALNLKFDVADYSITLRDSFGVVWVDTIMYKASSFDSLRLYFPFDGNANDYASYGGSNNGTVTGAVFKSQLDSFKVGTGAIGIDDNGDYIQLSAMNPCTSFTICVWINPTSDDIQRVIITSDVSNTAGIILMVNSSNVLSANQGVNWHSSTETVLASEGWTHVAYTYNYESGVDSTITLYKNGVPVYSDEETYNSQTAADWAVPILFAYSASAWSLIGQGDEFEFYSGRVLTELEIRNRYYNPATYNLFQTKADKRDIYFGHFENVDTSAIVIAQQNAHYQTNSVLDTVNNQASVGFTLTGDSLGVINTSGKSLLVKIKSTLTLVELDGASSFSHCLSLGDTTFFSHVHNKLVNNAELGFTIHANLVMVDGDSARFWVTNEDGTQDVTGTHHVVDIDGVPYTR